MGNKLHLLALNNGSEIPTRSFPLHRQASHIDLELCQRIVQVMCFDKHGLLDLILYTDGHEEVQRHARTLVCSMKSMGVPKRLSMPPLSESVVGAISVPDGWRWVRVQESNEFTHSDRRASCSGWYIGPHV